MHEVNVTVSQEVKINPTSRACGNHNTLQISTFPLVLHPKFDINNRLNLYDLFCIFKHIALLFTIYSVMFVLFAEPL